jgi:hypothetical protein
MELTDNDVYKIWLNKFNDHRYFRPNRWKDLKQAIIKNKVRSVLEFGSGVSTMLFDNLGLTVQSFETDLDYMNKVKSLCSPRVKFKLWWNNTLSNDYGDFDLALVDGILPRNYQLEFSLDHAPIVAIDDYNGRIKGTLLDRLSQMERIDTQKTLLAIFQSIQK